LPDTSDSTRSTMVSQEKTMTNVSVREADRRSLIHAKARYPELFCQADGCLHVVKSTPCSFHPIGKRVRILKQGTEDFGKFGLVDRAAGPFLWVLLEDNGEETKVPNDWVKVVGE
jgi:hypothetical protein